MNRYLLMSSMAAMVILPLWLSRVKNASDGLKATLTFTLVFNLAWAAVVLGWFFILLKDPQAMFPLPVEAQP